MYCNVTLLWQWLKLHYSDSDLMESGHKGIEAQGKVTYSRTPRRKRKQPAASGDDFLWAAYLMTRV